MQGKVLVELRLGRSKTQDAVATMQAVRERERVHDLCASPRSMCKGRTPHRSGCDAINGIKTTSMPPIMTAVPILTALVILSASAFIFSSKEFVATTSFSFFERPPSYG